MSRKKKSRQPTLLEMDDYAALGVDGDPNWENRSVFIGDCLDVMRQMNSGSVDLIYLDPPFNKKKQFQFPVGKAKPGNVVGKEIAFKDFWTWQDIHPYEADELKRLYPAAFRVIYAAHLTYDKAMAAYCLMIASRLIEMRRILKPAGSIYLHCDNTANHYLNILFDAIFGKNNFRNEIVWKRDAPGKGAKKKSRQLPRETDTILFYTKGDAWTYHQPTTELTDKQKIAYRYTENGTGRKYKAVQLGDYTEKSIEAMRKNNLIHTSSTNKQYKKYYLDEARATIGCIWGDILGFGVRTASKEQLGYPTQKPLALLERIIKTSSNEGDVVFDPFCGCATTLVAAEKLGRQYVGCDISPRTGQLLRQRLEYETRHGEVGKGGITPKPVVLKIPPVRSDLEPELTATAKREFKQTLYGLQSGNCAGCNGHFESRNLTLDRIVPHKNGGTYRKRNLQLLCGACNSMKGDKPQEYLMKRLADLNIIDE